MDVCTESDNTLHSDKYNYFQVCGQDVRPNNKVVGHSLLHVYAKWSMFMHASCCYLTKAIKLFNCVQLVVMLFIITIFIGW